MRRVLSKAFILMLLFVGSNNVDAQHYWALATMENEQEKPVVCEYHSLNEKGTNEIDYMRIYDDGFRFRKEPYSPVKTQYGYRMHDKKIYIYDYNKDEERLAFDFGLSVGERFTTYNGMEWKVEEVKDTFIRISPPMESGDAEQYKDVIVFRGLPKPIDSYLIDIYAELPTTEPNSIHNVSSEIEKSSIHNLQGRRLISRPTRGIYIQQGRKILVK